MIRILWAVGPRIVGFCDTHALEACGYCVQCLKRRAAIGCKQGSKLLGVARVRAHDFTFVVSALTTWETNGGERAMNGCFAQFWSSERGCIRILGENSEVTSAWYETSYSLCCFQSWSGQGRGGKRGDFLRSLGAPSSFVFFFDISFPLRSAGDSGGRKNERDGRAKSAVALQCALLVKINQQTRTRRPLAAHTQDGKKKEKNKLGRYHRPDPTSARPPSRAYRAGPSPRPRRTNGLAVR